MPKAQLQNRTAYVYLSSEKALHDWKQQAEKSHVSLSQFVYEHVTNSLRQEEGEDNYIPRSKLIEQLRQKDKRSRN